MKPKDTCQWRPTLTPLPCPFCGTKPQMRPLLKDVQAGREGSAYGVVYCASRRCPANPSVANGQQVADERGTGAYIDCAIRLWNRRNP